MILKNKKADKGFSFFHPKGKRGVSIIIGYILLVAVVMTISIVVYQWLKTYVPSDSLSCPDSVSISVINYTCNGGVLNLTLTNTGTFSIMGYYIHGSTTTNQLSTINLASVYSISSSLRNGAIAYPGKYACSSSSGGLTVENCLAPGNTAVSTDNGFDLSNLPTSTLSSPSVLKQITITPVRIEQYKNQPTVASCTSAEITMPVQCS